MSSTHKIIELLARITERGGKKPPSDEVFHEGVVDIKRALTVSGKFDLGRLEVEGAEALFVSGHEQRQEGLAAMPFDKTYFEGAWGDETTGILFNKGYAETTMGETTPPLVRDPQQYGVEPNVWIANMFTKEPQGWGLCTYHLLYDLDLRKASATHLGGPDLDRALSANETMEQRDRETVRDRCSTLLNIGLALLSSPDCEVVRVPAPDKLNIKRAKRGRGPLFSHHVLKIGGARQYGGGGERTHASPRKHWRRGHVRTLHRGAADEKKIILGPTIVGGRGFVSKDYEVVQ